MLNGVLNGTLASRLAMSARRVADTFGGMIMSPRATVSRLLDDGAPSPWWPLTALFAVALLANAKLLVRFAWLLDYGAESMMRRMRETLVAALRTDVAVVVVASAVLAFACVALSKRRIPWGRACATACWLLVPLLVVRALGLVVAAFGVDGWWLPQDAVDSMGVVVRGAIDWPRFIAKCVMAYGWPLALGLVLLKVAHARGQTAPAEPGAPTVDTAVATPMRVRAGGAALVALSMAAVVATGVLVNRLSERIKPALPGEALPEFALRELTAEGLAARRVKLSSFSGPVTVVDFWASWCAPCRRSMPELSSLSRELAPQGVRIVAVNREPEDVDAAARAWREMAVSFPGVLDDRFYGDKIGITTLPSTYVLDRRGVIRHFHMGYTEAAVLKAEITALLAEGERSAN